LLELFESKKVGPSDAELKLKQKAFYEKVNKRFFPNNINF